MTIIGQMEFSFYALFAGTYNEWPISQIVSVLLWNGKINYYSMSLSQKSDP